MEDLAAFLAEMVGDTPTSSVYYIHAMLDIDGDGLVTLPELKSALLEVKDVAASMEAAQGAELDREKRAALDALSRELRANQVWVASLVCKGWRRRTGTYQAGMAAIHPMALHMSWWGRGKERSVHMSFPHKLLHNN